MKSAVYIISNCLFALVFLVNSSQGEPHCDLNWIRRMFIMSCGIKKREVILDGTILDTLRENLLRSQADTYFYEYDPPVLEEVLIEEPIVEIPEYLVEVYDPYVLRSSSFLNRINPFRRNRFRTEKFPDLRDLPDDYETIVGVRNGMNNNAFQEMVNKCCSTDVTKPKCNIQDFIDACRK